MTKNAIVTGGNSGIGFETARKLKMSGYDVTITGRNEEKVIAAAKSIGCDYYVCDMADLEKLANLASRINSLDALILNAAGAIFKPIEATNLSDFDSLFDINVKGSYFLIQYLKNALAESSGAVCVVTSAIVENGLPNASLYAATKGAMDSLVKSLAVELAPNNIRINAVSPGAVDTPIIEKLGLPEDQIEAVKASVESTIPLGRYGYAEEIAHVIKAQIESIYVTGATWEVDGGVNAV